MASSVTRIAQNELAAMNRFARFPDSASSCSDGAAIRQTYRQKPEMSYSVPRCLGVSWEPTARLLEAPRGY